MHSISKNNKRIAKNTFLLYIRMFVLMFVGLFTSRIVLDALGVEDYGIYNIIGGIVVLFSFLNGSLLSATQRYLNFYLGKNDTQQTHKVFCMSMNFYLMLSALVLLLGEIVGLWFINNYLNIPTERLIAANWVYQFTLLTFVTSLLRIPYNASIIAYERMNFYAYISLIEVILKLAVVYFLYITKWDKLIIFAFLYLLTPVIITYIYKFYCEKTFSTTRFKLMWDKAISHSLFSFSGWSLFGNFANVIVQQGLNFLINIFQGVTANAAAGIANQVSSQLYSFIGNFQIAYNPQIVKTYSSGEMDRHQNLVFSASKLSYYLFFVLALPIFLEINSVLELWLTKIPIYTNIFCRLILVNMMIEAIAAPLWMSVQASGKIRNYQMMISAIVICNLPISYLLLKMEYPIYTIWVVRILVNLLAFSARCWFMTKYLTLSIPLLFKQVLLPSLYVSLLAIPVPLIMHLYIQDFWNQLLSVVIVSLMLSGCLIYLIGLNTNEKLLVKQLILSKFIKKQRK